jgi:hypothetical protein
MDIGMDTSQDKLDKLGCSSYSREYVRRVTFVH